MIARRVFFVCRLLLSFETSRGCSNDAHVQATNRESRILPRAFVDYSSLLIFSSSL
jgi:hypothetical protein